MSGSASVSPGSGLARDAPETRPEGKPDIGQSRLALGSDLVERNRLTDQLLGSTRSPFVVLEGPAGYSKTTCLAVWEAADRRDFYWLTSRPRHADPAALIAALSAALDLSDQIRLEVELALNTLKPDLALALERLSQAIGSIDSPFVLVLDDVHNLGDGESGPVLEALLTGLRRGSQLAIASRSKPPVSTGRLRANREMLELGPSELAMTRQESAALLAGIGLALTPDQAGRIYEKTEGWPAGLYLAGLALRTQGENLDEAVERFSGGDHLVVDYFRDEFLADVAGEDERFLRQTSVLDELSGPLCDAVLDRGDSATVLNRLMSENAMVVPLDREARSFRYHHLYADMLQFELQLKEPGVEREMHERASQWYDAAGDIESAIDHAVASGRIEPAGELIWRVFPELMSRGGRIATVNRWISDLGESSIPSCFPLMLALAHRDLLTGCGSAAERWAGLLRRKADLEPRSSEVWMADIHLLEAILARDGITKMEGDVALAMKGIDPGGVWQSPCLFYHGVARHLAGDPAAAIPALQESARIGAAQTTVMQALALAQLSLIAIDQGRPGEAGRLISQARDQVERCALGGLGALSLVYSVSALSLAGESRPLEAKKDVAKCLGLLTAVEGLPPWYEAEVRLTLCRSMLLLGDSAAAGLYERALEFLTLTPDSAVLASWSERVAHRLAGRPAGAGEQSLTPAEIRTLRYLPTHHSFRAIGEILQLSQNTVKTQANSVYRKFGVNSRHEAVQRAKSLGLLDPDPD